MTTTYDSTSVDATTTPRSTRGFVASFLEPPDAALLVVRGVIDADAALRVGVHLEGVRAGGARFVTVDATAVASSHRALLDVLGYAQRRLGCRRGLLSIRGLPPDLFHGTGTGQSGPASSSHTDP